MQRTLQRGFTLLEICIAMAIGSLLIGVAVMGISSVNDENALQRQASRIELTARESMIKAVMDQHPIRVEIPRRTRRRRRCDRQAIRGKAISQTRAWRVLGIQPDWESASP
jgi:prepilin-type N-terminal cleavage/methylation domain-containing protein